MAEQRLGFFQRLGLVLGLEWNLLFDDGTLAYKVRQAIDEGAALPPADEDAFDPGTATQLLSIFQRDGRLVDFLQEDVASFTDAEVGAAARVVHSGLREVLGRYVELEPIRGEEEGAAITVEEGYDPAELRLTGNVTGELPATGSLAHHGWRITALRLPAAPEGQDERIVAPAEIEV